MFCLEDYGINHVKNSPPCDYESPLSLIP